MNALIKQSIIFENIIITISNFLYNQLTLSPFDSVSFSNFSRLNNLVTKLEMSNRSQMHNQVEGSHTGAFCTSNRRAASRRATKFLRVVPANNRARGGRAGQNHLGIPFNRTASETNCGLTVCRLQPGQSEWEKGAKCRRKGRGRRARGVDSRPRLRFKWNWWITGRVVRGILAQRLMKLDTETLPRNSLRRHLAQWTHLFYAAYERTRYVKL